MRKAVTGAILALMLGAGFGPRIEASQDDLRILTYPIGLVTGDLPVDVDLGSTGETAGLYLDGRQVCTMTAAAPRCTLDLGPDPRLHLLELLRLDAAGHATARVTRWINRPGQEAELTLQFGDRSPQGICSGRAWWAHPLKQDPVLLEVTENGRNLLIQNDGRSFRFPCPDVRVPHILAASAIFPDGRRAEAVSHSGGFAGHAQTELTAVALSPASDASIGCKAAVAGLADTATLAEHQRFEVVFVLDPSAGYQTLMRTGWSANALPQTSSSTKQFDQMVQHGSKGAEPKPKVSWIKSESSLMDAEKLWFVAPNSELHRVNGFGQGKMNWLRLLFQFGPTKLDGAPRLADAVAASGLIAASGPQQRAVVLFLGNKSNRDESTFSAQQAQRYLAEAGVPLVVMRNGKLRDDGWPAGVPVKSMEGMANALMSLQADLRSQCVAWFPGHMHSHEIAASLPDGLRIAGRKGKQQGDSLDVWRRAETTPTDADDTEMVAATAEAAGRGELEITAMTVLVAATNPAGQPVADLDASTLTVTEDGAAVTVLGLEPVAAVSDPQAPSPTHRAEDSAQTAKESERDGMPIAIYIDRRLSGTAEIKPALNALSESAGWLSSFGPVDVVVADGSLSTILEGSTDAGELQNTLSQLADAGAGQHVIERIRTRFLRDIRIYPDRTEGLTRSEDGAPSVMDRISAGEEPQELERSKVLNAARSSIFEEDGNLRLSAEMVSDWALASPTARPRLLLVIGAGFDEDPVDFYLPFVERAETQHVGTAREDFKRFRQAERIGAVGRDLAAAGWLVIPVAGRTTGKQAGAADTGGGDRFQAFLSAASDASLGPQAEWLLLDPIGAQRHLAAPSGGKVIMASEGLAPLIEQTAGWYRLSYQIERAPDGALHQLSVETARPDVELKTSEVVASETSEGQAAVRIRRLLRGSTDSGSLNFTLVVAPGESAEKGLSVAAVSAEIDLGPIAPLFDDGEARTVRISVGVRMGKEIQFIHHRNESVTGPVGGWRYQFPLHWPSGSAQLAVIAEDLESGTWGGATQEIQ